MSNQVHVFVNPYKKSNNYAIEINEQDLVLVDFGNYSIEAFSQWIETKQKNIVALILTQEHAEHCNGVDELKKRFDFELYCSEKCETNMRNPKQNYSRYIEEFETFGVQSQATIVKDQQILNFKDFEIEVIETPGHSPGSICLFTEMGVFTGDTILNNVKSPLSFPHSNKKDFKKSIEKLEILIEEGKTIYPGHDEKFLFRKNEILN